MQHFQYYYVLTKRPHTSRFISLVGVEGWAPSATTATRSAVMVFQESSETLLARIQCKSPVKNDGRKRMRGDCVTVVPGKESARSSLKSHLQQNTRICCRGFHPVSTTPTTKLHSLSTH